MDWIGLDRIGYDSVCLSLLQCIHDHNSPSSFCYLQLHSSISFVYQYSPSSIFHLLLLPIYSLLSIQFFFTLFYFQFTLPSLFLLLCFSQQSINLHACGAVTDKGVLCIAEQCTRLQSMILYGCEVTDRSVLALVLSCPYLRSIYLSAWCLSKVSKNILQMSRSRGVIVHCIQ